MSKQKRKTRHFALLLSLCLTLNLCVVPIAAAEAPDLERLESELEQAKEAREAAERAFADAQSRAEAADEAREHLEEVRKNLEDAAGEETDSLQEAVEKAEKALEAAEAAAPAQEELEELQSKVAEASTRVIRAQEAYDAALAAARAEEEEKRKQEEEEKKKQEEEQKRKEEEEKKKQEEEKRQALTPGSGDLSFSESSVNFGSLEKGASSGLSKTVTITNNGRYVMALSVSSPSGFSVSGVPSSLAPGKSAAASIALTSVKTAGEYSGNVQISGYYEDGGARGDSRTFSISVYAKVTEKGYTISADPSSKDMGKLKEGYSEEDAEAKEFTVTIENKGAGDVRLNGVKGADHFTVTAVK